MTHAANNHRIHVTADDGTVSTKVVRDSTDKPTGKRATKAVLAPLPPPPVPRDAKAVTPWTPPVTRTGRRSSSSATAYNRRAADSEEVRLMARVQEIGCRLRPSSAAPASERLRALRSRVLGFSE